MKYVIRGGVDGRERLRLLSEVFGPSTRALLAEVDLTPGARCLDLGCGGGDVSLELARAVGQQGRVVGVDYDEIKLASARQEAEAAGFSNIDFAQADVTKWEPREKYDVVYARFLLTHLSNPAAVLSQVHRHLRPGGVVIVEDIDFRGHFSEPECPALKRFVELYSKSVTSRGADPDIGPRLPGLMWKAGFTEIQMRMVHPAALEGGIKLLTCVTLESIADAVLQDGLVTKAEFRETIEELTAFARDPHTLLGGPRVFQVWGRR